MIRLPMSENRIEPSWSSAPPSVNDPSPQTFSSFAAWCDHGRSVGRVLEKGDQECQDQSCVGHGGCSWSVVGCFVSSGRLGGRGLVCIFTAKR